MLELAQIIDPKIFDAILNSAGVGAAIGWVVQFYMWKSEREERREAHTVIVSMVKDMIASTASGTSAMNALTTAVNAIISVSQKDK